MQKSTRTKSKGQREQKKILYAEFLRSTEWRLLRADILKRDHYKCRSWGCGSRAQQVHHIRYPKDLGKQNPEWLFSLCHFHHEEIHELVKDGTTLRKATKSVLAGRTGEVPAPWTRAPTEEEIIAAQPAHGGWTRKQLAEWGVPWPPPRGWKKKLVARSRKVSFTELSM